MTAGQALPAGAARNEANVPTAHAALSINFQILKQAKPCLELKAITVSFQQINFFGERSIILR